MIHASRRTRFLFAACLGASLVLAPSARAKDRIFVVSSYHPEYLWSQDTNRGLCAALLQLKYLDSPLQADEYTRTGHVESSRAVLQKAWMDTKRRGERDDISRATSRIVAEIRAFKPDLILLGDDNAANFIGNAFIDTDTPVVFWGMNGLPTKYGLIDKVDRPGHNVTGVYQAGYVRECLLTLQQLVPGIRTFAILSDDSETGRAKAKDLQQLAQSGQLPLELTATVITNSEMEWKREALKYRNSVDAFFVLNHNTLKDLGGEPVDPMRLGAWYLRNIHKPDCGNERQFVEEGILLTVDDSGYKQGAEAMRLADEILSGRARPADIPVRAPSRGAVIVNRERAQMLGIDLAGKDFVEEYIEQALALEKAPRKSAAVR